MKRRARPFWSDDFDMDLLKVIPNAEQLLGDVAPVPLYTHASVRDDGSMAHPTCWNHQLGLVAFFGLLGPAKSGGYVTHDPIVECTFLELVRDAWVHTYVPVVEGVPLPIIGTRMYFEPLMSHVRGWHALPEDDVAKLKRRVRIRLRRAADVVRAVIHAHSPAGLR